MLNIIMDFIKSGQLGQGVDLFEDDPAAVRISRTISNAQIRRFRHYGEVPGPFFLYLRQRGILPSWVLIPKKSRGYRMSQLLKILWEVMAVHPNRNLGDAADFIRKELLSCGAPRASIRFRRSMHHMITAAK